ncbi:MAG: hypothetical protein AAF447_24260 [Myxococcota bacterium]
MQDSSFPVTSLPVTVSLAMHRIPFFAFFLLASACTQTSTVFVDGGVDEDAATAPDPTSEAIAVAADAWETSRSNYIEFGCACRGITCLGLDFWRPFAECVDGLLGQNTEARQEFAEVAACYAEGFAESEICLETATCDTVGDLCERDFDCVFTRCDVGLSDTLRNVYPNCTLVGGPGGFGDIEDCR